MQRMPVKREEEEWRKEDLGGLGTLVDVGLAELSVQDHPRVDDGL
jgi:hypothetical protein